MNKKFYYALILLLLIGGFYALNFSGMIKEIPQNTQENSVTFFGKDIKEYSLVFASLIIGLLDGFNPCAMWVLIYLITLVSQLKDRKKMWLIVGTFVFAEGIIYYIILVLWLNGWDFINYLIEADWIIKGAALFALSSGIYFIYDFIKSGGKLECEISDLKKRQKTISKIRNIVYSKFTFVTFIALFTLAFAINITEFVCSIGLPALFTQILSISDVNIFLKYVYIFLYDLAFMADDIIIFSLALLAIDSEILQKYNGLVKLIGGILMIGLGILLIFFPGVLI